MSEKAQIAVVGSGPGGAVAACVLAEAGRDVVLWRKASLWASSPAGLSPWRRWSRNTDTAG